MIDFPFLNTDVGIINCPKGHLKETLTPDAFLTGVLYAPYLVNRNHMLVFNAHMQDVFTGAWPIQPDSNAIRNVYYTAIKLWHEDRHMPLTAHQCFMARQPAADVTRALRIISETINNGSIVLQQFMTGQTSKYANAAIVIKEVARLCDHYRREYPIATLDLFTHLYETVSAMRTHPNKKVDDL